METVVVLGRQRIDSHISVDLDVKKLGIKSGNATYDDIKAYVREKYGFEVHSAYIGQVKEKLGIVYDSLELPRKITKITQNDYSHAIAPVRRILSTT